MNTLIVVSHTLAMITLAGILLSAVSYASTYACFEKGVNKAYKFSRNTLYVVLLGTGIVGTAYLATFICRVVNMI